MVTVASDGKTWLYLCLEARRLFNRACRETLTFPEQKVRALTHSHTHSLTHSLIHSLTHTLTHSLTHSHTHSPFSSGARVSAWEQSHSDPSWCWIHACQGTVVQFTTRYCSTVHYNAQAEHNKRVLELSQYLLLHCNAQLIAYTKLSPHYLSSHYLSSTSYHS